MARYIRYLENGEWKYASIKDVGEIDKLATANKTDIVSAINELVVGGNDFDIAITDINELYSRLDGELQQALLDLLNKADLSYVNGELVKYVDLEKYNAEYQTILGDLLAKVDYDSYVAEYNAMVEELKKKATTADVDTKLGLLNQSIASANAEIAGAKESITTAKNEISGLESKVAGEIATINGSLSQQGARIESAENAIALKANSADVYTKTDADGKISTSVESAKAEIKLETDAITQSVGKLTAEITDYGTRISDAETKISQTAESINLKANASDVYKKTEVDGKLGDKVDTTTYNNKVSQIDIDISGIKSSVSSQETDISGLKDGVTTNRENITIVDQKADGIKQTVSSQATEISNLDGTVKSHTSSISTLEQTAEGLTTRVGKTETDISGLEGRVSTAETTITQTKESIELKADKTEVSSIDGRLQSAEASIKVNADSIEQKVSKLDYDDSVGVNKWIVSRYDINLNSATEIPKFSHINGIVPNDTVEIQDDKRMQPFTTDHYIAHYFTNIHMSARKTVQLTMASLNGIGVYLNGAKIYEDGNSGSGKSVSISFRAGWNTLEVLHHEYTGTGYVDFGVTLSKQVDKMTAHIGIGDKNDTRLVNAESAIIQNADSIKLKASQDEVTSLGNRVSSAESEINVLNDKIELKATQSDLDSYSQRLSTAEGTLTVQAGQIASKVEQKDFDLLNGRVSSAETSLEQTKESIALKANKSDFDALEGRVSSAESSLTVANDQIATKVSQKEIDDAIGDLVDGEITDIKGRVSSAESSITQQANAIALKANQTALDAITGRVESAESSLSVQAGLISSKVEKNGIISAINQSAESVTIDAKKIKLNGSITFGDFNSSLQTDFGVIQTNASSALDTANTAKSTADTAKSTADSASSKATTAQNAISDMSSDLKITPVEKQVLSREWEAIKVEYAQLISQSSTLGVSSTNLTSAYTLLDSTSPKIASEILSSLTTTYTFGSTTLRDTFKNKISAYYTQAESLRTSISTKINSTATTANSNASSAVSTATSAKNTADTAKSTADTAKSTADTAKSTANTANSNASTALSTANTAKSDASTALTNANTAKTTADTAKTTIDNLSIGGRNIFKQSGRWKVLPTWWKNNGGGIELDTTVKYLGYNTLKTTVGAGIVGNNGGYFEVDTNKVYTYSAMIRSTETYSGTSTTPLHFHCSTDGSSNNSTIQIISYEQSTVANQWKLLYLTFKPLGKYFRPYIYIGSTTRVFNIAYLQLEEGNRATSWTPAPEDLEEEVATAKTAIDQMTSDLYITPVEKTNLLIEWNKIKAEYTQVLANANAVSVSATNYTNAYNALNSTTPKIESEVLASMTSTYTFASTTTRDTFRTKMTTYYTQLETLRKAINDKVNSTATSASSNASSALSTANSAKSTADTAKSTADTAKSTATSAQSTANTANSNASTALSTANTSVDIAKAMANGKLLYTDPTFKSGVNSVNTYNNSGNGTVTVTRITRPSDAPTTSTHAMEIKTTGTASPGWGGFYQNLSSRANAKFVVRYIIKLPVGYNLNTASNSMGTGYSDKFVGSTAGTGKYQEYIRVVQCGSTGTFSGGGHVYVTGSPTPTTSAPLVWYLANISAYDVTDADYTAIDASKNASSALTVVGNWAYDSNKTYINGGKIYTSSITSSQIDVNNLFAQNIVFTGKLRNGMTSLADTTNNGVYIGTDGIALGKGAFKVTSAGALTATSATIKGTITSTAGSIGGFTLSGSSLRSGMTSLSDTTNNGVYVGTDGIALGKGAFKVTNAGTLTANNATIKGTITGSNITGSTVTTKTLNSKDYIELSGSEFASNGIEDYDPYTYYFTTKLTNGKFHSHFESKYKVEPTLTRSRREVTISPYEGMTATTHGGDGTPVGSVTYSPFGMFTNYDIWELENSTSPYVMLTSWGVETKGNFKHTGAMTVSGKLTMDNGSTVMVSDSDISDTDGFILKAKDSGDMLQLDNNEIICKTSANELNTLYVVSKLTSFEKGGISIKTGGLEMNNTNITNVNQITIADPGENEGIKWLGGNGWSLFEGPSAGGNGAGGMQFFAGGSRVFTVNTNGNLSTVGTTLFLDGTNSLVSGTSGYIVIRSAQTNYVYLQGSEVRATKPSAATTYIPVRGSSFPTSSSVNYKQNIRELSYEDAKYILDSTNVFTYHLNSNLEMGIYDKPKTGMITEMVPQALRDEDGVDPYSVVATLWRVVKEQDKMIESLNSEVGELKSMIETIVDNVAL